MKKILILFVCFALLFTGCKSDSSGTTDAYRTPFIGGNAGLLLSFSEGAPPEDVYDGDDFPFSIDVVLKNDGEYTIPEGRAKVKVTGILSSDFGDVDLEETVEDELVKTEKDSEGNILEGTEYHTEFNDLQYTGELSGNTPFTIRADACYEYKTEATAKICVREDITDTQKEGVCVVTEKKVIYNSGAPVQIVEFEEKATGTDKISLIFKIQKKGNGDIFRSKYMGGDDTPNTQCIDERKYRDKIWISVDSDNSALNNNMNCQGIDTMGVSADSGREGYVSLYSGLRTVRCNIDLGDAGITGDFEKVIKISLTYDYEEDISTNILVKHTVDG